MPAITTVPRQEYFLNRIEATANRNPLETIEGGFYARKQAATGRAWKRHGHNSRQQSRAVVRRNYSTETILLEGGTAGDVGDEGDGSRDKRHGAQR